MESSFDLIQRAQGGDDDALNSLLERYLPRLRRWASGRLPAYARDLGDTNDLIQEAAIGTFRNFPRFQQRGEGGLHAYLRTAVVNRIHDEVRRAGRRPPLDEISTALPTPQDLAPRARDRAGGPRPLRARARAARRRRELEAVLEQSGRERLAGSSESVPFQYA